MRTRLAIWFLLLSAFSALALGNNGVPPFFGVPTFIDTFSIIDTNTATSGTTITRSALNFGTNVTGRVIVASIGWAASASRQISSVSIGGSTATVAADCTAGGAAAAGGAVYYGVVAGTTGQSIVITFTNTIVQFSYTAYRLIASSSTPLSTVIASCPNAAVVYNVSVVKGAALFAGNRIASATGALVYSGTDTLTTDSTITNGSSSTSANGSVSATETASRTLRFNPSPGTTSGTGVVAIWH